MRSIEKAREDLFQTSTPEELFAYAEQSGLKLHKNTKPENVRRALCNTLGVAYEAVTPQIAKIRALKPKTEIFPSYELGPNGVFGGKRHRGKLHRPHDASPKQKAETFQWNGKAPYHVRYNVVEVIPEPILNRILECQRPVKTVDIMKDTEGNAIEQRTAWTFERKHNWESFGVDDDTAHLCGSLLEWYQQKGPMWFTQRSLRELQMIAEKLDVPTHTRNADNKKTEPLKQDELLGKVNTFVFGHPEVEDADMVSAEAAL